MLNYDFVTLFFVELLDILYDDISILLGAHCSHVITINRNYIDEPSHAGCNLRIIDLGNFKVYFIPDCRRHQLPQV